MKEVTVWDNRPRWMWCWDDNENIKGKKYVVCILTEEQLKECGANYPVKCGDSMGFFHCAEIEETKRPCVREELLEMLRKQGLQMIICKDNGFTYSIIRLNREEITVISVTGSPLTYNYRELCETFTLLNGSELWIKG